MLVGMTLLILIVLLIFSLIIGEDFVEVSAGVGVDNTVLLNGTLTTYEVPAEDIIFGIDPVIGGIAIIIAVVAVASIAGVMVLGSGLSPATVRVIIYTTAYSSIWGLLSVLVSGLIKSINVFGSIIYVILTLGYTIGVIQKLSGGNE